MEHLYSFARDITLAFLLATNGHFPTIDYLLVASLRGGTVAEISIFLSYQL